MVQAANFRDGDYLTHGWWLYLPPEGRVPMQGEVRTGVVIVSDVAPQEDPKMVFSENDQVIDALASNRADNSLGVWVLPGRSRSGDDLSNAHSLHSCTEIGSVDRIAVAEKIAGNHGVARKGLDHLLRSPLGRRMTGHVEVHNTPAVVCEDDEAEQ